MRVWMQGIAAGLLAATIVMAPFPGDAQPAPDFARATSLYTAANTALSEGRYEDALRDFSAAYDITHDAVLFYKIGNAHEKAGRCDVALIYFGRYLKEAHPSPQYVDLTREHIRACGGDDRNIIVEPAPVVTGSGSAEPAGSAAGSAAPPVTGSAAGSGSAEPVAAEAGSAAGSGAGSTEPEHASMRGRDGAWLMVGGALAFVTIGAVCAYSASSAEQDLQDLYIGINGKPPAYDTKTAERYQSLIDDGHRYQYLSWGAFAIATAFTATATYLFLRDRPAEHHVAVTPVVSPQTTGVAAIVRF